jgi:hypothetical protein
MNGIVQLSSVKSRPFTSDSVGQDISISDLTSEILPRDPLMRILPFIVEETNISLNASLPKL